MKIACEVRDLMDRFCGEMLKDTSLGNIAGSVKRDEPGNTQMALLALQCWLSPLRLKKR